MSIVVFEDPVCDLLAPITTGRLAATISCGSYRLVDLVAETGLAVYGISRSYLEPIQAMDCSSLKVLNELTFFGPGEGEVKLLLNARVAPTELNRKVLQNLLKERGSETLVVRDRDTIAAVLNPKIDLSEMAQIPQQGFAAWLQSRISDCRPAEHNLITFMVPHEIIATNMKCIAASLEARIARNSYRQHQDGVFVGKDTKLGEFLIFDTKNGPIIIDDGAQIGPYSLLRGPIYVGKNCKILEHSAIKDQVSLGHTTKIGGEVEASIVEPFTNKQHHGFLGHSYLGSWINLGAGTCNSDLKNTYGTVNMEYPHGKAATGMQFLGCIMGNYSKTAINTGIFTGKVIGVCSMMYGFVTSNVPSFVNYARLFGQVVPLPADVMIATQKRMFARRSVEQRPCDIQLIHDMFRITQFERDQSIEL
jgi:glucose-1-phosphate thymidylyltransferase